MRCPHPRTASPAPVWINLAKTAGQIVLFWGFFLAVVPYAILRFEDLIGWDAYRFDSTATKVLGVLLFAVMGSLGLHCAFIFATRGQGTPFPLDATTRFLIEGPYRYVRNPMAIAGTAQGVAVGLYFGSPIVITYAIAGMFAWNFLARHWEETDLAERFGEPYLRYRDEVRCWIPRAKPYDVHPVSNSLESGMSKSTDSIGGEP